MRIVLAVVVALIALTGCSTTKSQQPRAALPMPAALVEAGFKVKEVAVPQGMPGIGMAGKDYLLRVTYQTPQGETAIGDEVELSMKDDNWLEISVPTELAKAQGAIGYNVYLRFDEFRFVRQNFLPVALPDSYRITYVNFSDKAVDALTSCGSGNAFTAQLLGIRHDARFRQGWLNVDWRIED